MSGPSSSPRCGPVDRGTGRAAAGALQALLAIAVGSLTFLPWVPAFLYQAANTGTPWGRLPPPRVPFDVVFQFAAAQPDLALPLGLLLYALVVLGIFGVPAVAGVVGLDLRGRPPGRALTMVAVATLVIGVAAGRLTGAAFAVRYAAVVFPLVVLLAGLGYAVLAPSRAGPWALAWRSSSGSARRSRSPPATARRPAWWPRRSVRTPSPVTSSPTAPTSWDRA